MPSRYAWPVGRGQPAVDDQLPDRVVDALVQATARRWNRVADRRWAASATVGAALDWADGLC
jgi:hypothetical protein